MQAQAPEQKNFAKSKYGWIKERHRFVIVASRCLQMFYASLYGAVEKNKVVV